MKMKKCLSILLAVVMIATMITSLPITANAAEVDAAGVGEDTELPVGDATALKDACKEINDGAGGTYTISLTNNIENGQVVITNPNAVVTVIGNGNTISATGSAVYVSGGAKVILGDGTSNLTLTSADNNDTPGILHILKDSSCTMKNQVTLRDHDGQNYLGGGVTVDGGTFVMDGGTITNCSIAGTVVDNNGGSVCYGGGVAVFNSGTFTMNGGTITECYATTDYVYPNDPNQISGIGGGVFVTSGSVFNMNGGTISNCTASLYGGGVAVVSANQTNNFTSKVAIKKDATISGNKASGGAGVFISGPHYAHAVAIAMDAQLSGTISGGNNSTTAGLEDTTPNSPGLYIRGGLITDNHANGEYVNEGIKAHGLGGGVLVLGLKNDVQIHQAQITSNYADCGAGIVSYSYSTQADIDGCTITGNIANKNGGGVYLGNKITKKDDNTYYSPKTTIKNTTITGNTSGDRGAGVYYNADSELHISGRDVIQNNTFNGTLNNLNVLIGKKSTTGSHEELIPVYVDGALTGSQIGLSDPRLWDDGKSDIEAPDNGAAELLTNGYKENNPDVHPSEYFTSDHETWIVERTEKTTTEVGDPSSKYRVYTVDRYPVENIGKYIYVSPKKQWYYQAPYSGNIGQYDISDIQKPELQNKSSLTQADILDELKYRFETTGNYDVTGGPNPYRPSIITYTLTPKSNTPLASGPLSTIKIETKNNDSYNIYLTYTPKQFTGTDQMRGGAIEYSANIQNQPYPGKLLLTITKNNNSQYLTDPNNDYYRFSTNPTSTTTVEYVNENLLDPLKTLYEYDKETGDINAKLIPTSYVEEYAKTTTTVSGTDEEVRLVRKKTVDYHINNDVIDDKYGNSDIFTDEITAADTTVTVGEPITSFYTVPEPDTDKKNSCPYIFKGWYYDKANDNNSRPVKFGEDTYTAGHDIYAHWIEVNDVAQDSRDPYGLPNGYTAYGGFDMAGVQIREDRTRDSNFDGKSMPGGMRFITSLSMDVVNEINSIQENNIEYGYVAANATNDDWITYHNKAGRKLQYASENTNGVNTVSDDPDKTSNENYFAFATNINCTSRRMNPNGVVANDHRNYNGYLLYTLVITYEGEDASAFNKNVLARPYIKYTDANGLPRVAYSDYRGTSNPLGGCYTSYNYVMNHQPQEG